MKAPEGSALGVLLALFAVLTTLVVLLFPKKSEEPSAFARETPHGQH